MSLSISSAHARRLSFAIALSVGGIAAQAQQDALVIDRDSVRIATNLAVTGKVTADAFSGSFLGMGAVPVGAILMWSGDPEQLPPGWALCDGRQLADGTTLPDLSGRFIVGHQASSQDYAVGQTGGEDRHALSIEEMPGHNHSATLENAGEHSHTMQGSQRGWAFDMVQSGDKSAKPFKTIRTDAAGAHVHGVRIGATGGGQPHENRPPYYVLAYIQYVGG